MKLIQQAMEDHYDGLVKNEGSHDELEFQRKKMMEMIYSTRWSLIKQQKELR